MQRRAYSAAPQKPRHLLSIDDLTPQELHRLVIDAGSHKTALKSGKVPVMLENALKRKTIAMLFSKRSTRTRVSTEAAVTTMGGHPMFLGREDIQLGVNESLQDTSRMISSVIAGIVARVGPHDDILELAKYSKVPVISGLSDLYHPLQTIADLLTVYEKSSSKSLDKLADSGSSPVPVQGIKIAWVGDANNVLFDLAIGAAKLGLHVSVATPQGYEIPDSMRTLILKNAESAKSGMTLSETNVPEEAVKDADVIVTDTWVSMGWEDEKAKRLRDFSGFEVTEELGRRGGAKKDWYFMHCLPRHPEEVSDEVFYGPRSIVFQEAENRLWAAIAALHAFIVNKGHIDV